MRRIIIYCIVASFLLFISSFYYIDYILNFFFRILKKGTLSFNVTKVNETFIIAKNISLSIGAIPLLLMACWAVGKITSVRKRIFSILIQLAAVALAIFINVIRIENNAAHITSELVSVKVPIGEMYFHYAIFGGAFLGATISYLIFLRRQAKEELTRLVAQFGEPE